MNRGGAPLDTLLREELSVTQEKFVIDKCLSKGGVLRDTWWEVIHMTHE
jgi:hypothetical protein